MLAALGAVFLDAEGHTLDATGARLGDIAHVDTRNLADLSELELVVAADVTNPLLGADGAAAVFGPQKGAYPDQVTALDQGLARLVRLLPANLGGDTAALAAEPGAGAAGGLGFACSWLGGQRVAGAEFFLDLLSFDEALAACDAVVTREGCMDGQTLNGKLPAVVARRSAPRPVYAVVGQSRLRDEERGQLGLEGIEALSALTTADPSADAGLSRALATRAGERIGHELRTALHLGLPSR